MAWEMGISQKGMQMGISQKVYTFTTSYLLWRQPLQETATRYVKSKSIIYLHCLAP